MARIPKRPPLNKQETRTEHFLSRPSDRNGASRPVRQHRGGLAFLVVVLALNTPGTMSAQPDTDRSLNADKPATVPGAAAAATNAAPDLSTLTREQLEARVKTLTEDLTLANTESEFFRQQWQKLKLEDEALGVEALTVDETKMKDKLVQAVAELYQSEMKRREALQLLDKLLLTTEQMIQTAPKYDPKVRADYEVASRAAKDYLAGHNAGAIPLGISLSEGQISDLNPQLNAVILNVGRSQGVKEGMPFIIYQGKAQVATVKIVLARELVSAALVESLKPNTVLKIGDRAAVDARQ